MQAADARQGLLGIYKINRVERAPVGFLPFVASQALKIGAKYLFSAKVLPTLISTGAVGHMGIRGVQTKIAALMLNITDLEYNQVEGQINAVIDQKETAINKQEILQCSM